MPVTSQQLVDTFSAKVHVGLGIVSNGHNVSIGHVDGHNGRPMDTMEFSVFVNCVHFGNLIN
jgi:hypothetical protein